MRPNVRPSDLSEAMDLKSKLLHHHASTRKLPGIKPQENMDCLLAQLIDSLRRVRYAKKIGGMRHGASVKDPGSAAFNPLKAAVLYSRTGELDEAWWLVFLATHFGKHSTDGWKFVKAIYGRLGGGNAWDWATTSQNATEFKEWIAQHQSSLKKFRFSNHRKYESVVSTKGQGIGDVVESYINWISPPNTSGNLIRSAHQLVGQDPKEVFDYLYRSMEKVKRFGRLGKFDFLTMLDKLGLAPIVAGSAYLSQATGPLCGARLLFGGNTKTNISSSKLESYLADLDRDVQVGMQVLEDSLCNWQKSPANYLFFR